MSSPPEPEHSEPVFIILSGFKGRYQSIQRAYNYGHPALEWSRKEVKQTITGGGDPNTDFPDNKTREMSTWANDENGIYARFGFTVVEKILALPCAEELPYGTSQVHIVCDEGNLEISYVSTEHSDAEKVCEKQGGSVVKSVEYVRQQDIDRLNDADVDEDQAHRVYHAWKAHWAHWEDIVKALPESIARLGMLGLQM